jgi:hypothetical protein
MRADLPPPDRTDALADMVAARMAAVGADEVHLVVYSSRTPLGRRPYAELVTALCDRVGVTVPAAVLVSGARVWCYLCRGCDMDGRSLRPDSAGPLRLAAAHALLGRVVLPDRAALVASVQPYSGTRARALRAATTRALRRRQQIGAEADDAKLLRLAVALLDRYAAPPAGLRDGEAARLIAGLQPAEDPRLRDLILRAALTRRDVTYRMLHDLARCAQPSADAVICTMLACVAYLDGRGAVAWIALERAQASAPDYELARLVSTAIDGQVPPEVLAAALSDPDRRGGLAGPRAG